MPLWTIYHSPQVFTASEKAELASVITAHYEAIGLPRFYVVVSFHQLSQENLFVGGEQAHDAVRIVIEHIARQHPDSASRRRTARWIRQMLSPFADRYDGLHWEFHVDETSEELWMVNGLVPPPGGSDDERTWAAKNVATPY